MNAKERFYSTLINKIIVYPENQNIKRVLIMKLVQDIYKGYDNQTVIEKVIHVCGIDKQTWNSYLHAYLSFKKYESLSEYDESEPILL